MHPWCRRVRILCIPFAVMGASFASALSVARNGTSGPCVPDTVSACLLATAAIPRCLCMFVVTEADAAAIRDVFEREGELSAVIEVRRRFPGITDNAKAREHARTGPLPGGRRYQSR
jgi:hypothetical protein